MVPRSQAKREGRAAALFNLLETIRESIAIIKQKSSHQHEYQGDPSMIGGLCSIELSISASNFVAYL